MKAEHRHELKTNELAEWLTHLPQWFKENRRVIIYLTVVTVIVVGLYLWKWYNKNVVMVQQQVQFSKLVSVVSSTKTQILRGQAQGLDISYMLLQPADSLKDFAEITENDEMAALAFVKRGQVLRMELHYRLETVSEADVKSQIEKAKESYALAIERAGDNSLLVAKARFGLGLCEEELGNFEAARNIYSAMTADEHLEGTPAVAAAKLRVDSMADYQRKIVFREPEVTDAPMRPVINVGVLDSNLPGE